MATAPRAAADLKAFGIGVKRGGRGLLGRREKETKRHRTLFARFLAAAPDDRQTALIQD